MAGRLVAIAGLFATAVLLELAGAAPYSERALTALYALVLAGFLSSLGYAVLVAARRDRSLWVLELAGDGVLITGLVYATGGGRSVFAFLYVVWIVYAAVRSGTPGALITPVVSAAGYAGVAWGLARGWLPPLEPVMPSAAETLRAIGTHTAAFALVSVLAHRLAQQVKRGRQELHELGEIHRRIFDNVGSGLLAIDERSLITSFNREAERITGFREADVRGWALDRMFPELGGAEGAGDGADGPLSRHQMVFENRRGERLHLGLSRSVLRDSDGRPEGSVLIFQDLTRVVHMEADLRRSERLAAVGQLAAGLAHEVRNPLASLSGSIELLEREWRDPGPDARRLVRIVHRETERLNRLVSEFLSYARPGLARRERVRLQPLAEEIGELVARSVGDEPNAKPRAELQVTVHEDLCVAGDPDQLRQVLWNLVLNAIEAEPADGCVAIRAQAVEPLDDSGATIAIEIRDRGRGIAVDDLERVQEPFFTTKATGTGLGLATVHRMIEAHGGRLQIESAVGQGTCVRIRLPRHPGDGDAADPSVKAD